MHVAKRIPQKVDFYNNLDIESLSCAIILLKGKFGICMMVEGLPTSIIIKEYFDLIHV